MKRVLAIVLAVGSLVAAAPETQPTVLRPDTRSGASPDVRLVLYNYDAHIPLIVMGRGVKPGAYSNHVALNDLAPTLSTLLGIETPSGSSGRVLTEALSPAPKGAPAAPR